jgi:hypothetical protein
MFKKILSVLLLLCLILSVASCGNKGDDTSSQNDTSSEIIEPVEVIINPFTGESGYSKDRVNKRPLAVTINNLYQAQAVQSNIDKADIIFETEVEGGITRLLAIYSDPASIKGKIGTLRSARVAFAGISKGLGAYYVHHGYDPTYCMPYMNQIGIERINIGSPYTFREPNGLAWEHTLYTTGESLGKLITDKKWDKETTVKPFATFTAPGEANVLSENSAAFVRVPFSYSYVTDFLYDAETGKYARARNKEPLLDLVSGGKQEFKNVLILKTNIVFYENGYRKNVELEGGSGYYMSGGNYIEIKWTKGDADNNFKFTDLSGNPLTLNSGKSYICIVNKNAGITIE